MSSGKLLGICVIIIDGTAEINLSQPIFIYSFYTAVASVEAGQYHEEDVEEADVEEVVDDVDEPHANLEGADMYIW